MELSYWGVDFMGWPLNLPKSDFCPLLYRVFNYGFIEYVVNIH